MSSRSSFDSLFDDSETPDASDASEETKLKTDNGHASAAPVQAGLSAAIPGLWVFPALLPDELARDTLGSIGAADVFAGGARDQVMLFDAPPSVSRSTCPTRTSKLPSYVTNLLSQLHDLLRSRLPSEILDTLFAQDLARQVILNLYPPGEGISSHIDLPGRYADGILGVSLVGGCTMTFSHSTTTKKKEEVYLPPRTVYVLIGEARWDWAHGIDRRLEDLVQREDGRVETVLRDLRVSATFRWMKDGADLLS